MLKSNLSSVLIEEIMPLFEGMVDSMIYKIEDESLKKQWQEVFDRAKQVFNNRMDYVNWFFNKTFDSFTADATYYLDKFKKFYDLNISSINNISVIKYNTVQEALDAMQKGYDKYIVRYCKNKWNKNVIPLSKIRNTEQILVCSDSHFMWFNLHSGSQDEIEADVMGHCGGEEGCDTVLSLREKVFVNGKLVGYEPHVTAAYYGKHKRVSQVKGKDNEKPEEEYHKFIKELFYSGYIRDFGGGDYLSENDFGWGDFSEDEIIEIAKSMKELPRFLKYEINELFWVAIRKRDVESIKRFIDVGADIHAGDDNALIWASIRGYTRIVKLLLDAGAYIHAQDDAALIEASKNGHVNVVKLLLDRGADVHAGDDDALTFSSEYGHADVVELLLDAGADVHASDDYALVRASESGYTDVVNLLKKHAEKTQKG